MNFILLILISFLTISSNLYAQERRNSFVIIMTEEGTKVLAPLKKQGLTNIIVQNKTLLNTLGKFVNQQNQNLKFITVPSSSLRSTSLKMKNKDVVYFIPLAPAFQKVKLSFGEEAYEIP